MAQLNSRGTQTRGRWDYFEHSNGIAFVSGSVTTGPIGAYFANNSTGATAIDVYTINWMASVSLTFTLMVFPPPFSLTPVTPTDSNVRALQADLAAPPGLVGMYSFGAAPYIQMLRYSAGSTGAQVAPITGNYFTTLPPGWAIAVECGVQSNPVELSMTVWYQYVTDNIAPAQ